MPVSDRRIVVRIHSGQPYAAWNSKEARIFVPPLNTVEDMEIWRHELRHALEGHWH